MKDVVAVSIILNPKEIPSSLILTEEHIKELIYSQIEEDQLEVRTGKLDSTWKTKTAWTMPNRIIEKLKLDPNQELSTTRIWVFITVEDPNLDSFIKEKIKNHPPSYHYNGIKIPFKNSTEFTIHKVELRGELENNIIIPSGKDGKTYNLVSPKVYGDEILECFLDIASGNRPGFFHDVFEIVKDVVDQEIEKQEAISEQLYNAIKHEEQAPILTQIDDLKGIEEQKEFAEQLHNALKHEDQDLILDSLLAQIDNLNQERETQQASYKQLESRFNILKPMAVYGALIGSPFLLITALILPIALLTPLILATAPVLFLVTLTAISLTLALLGPSIINGFLNLADAIEEQFDSTLEEKNQQIIELNNQIQLLQNDILSIINSSESINHIANDEVPILEPEAEGSEVNIVASDEQLKTKSPSMITKLSAPVGSQNMFPAVRKTQVESQLTYGENVQKLTC